MALDPSSAAATPKLSAYATSLDPTAKTRYLEKIAIVSHYDPMLGVPRGCIWTGNTAILTPMFIACHLNRQLCSCCDELSLLLLIILRLQ